MEFLFPIPSKSSPQCLIYMLPKELWKFHICFSFLCKKDLATLRLVCRFFRCEILVSSSALTLWRQWIPFTELTNYETECQQFNFPPNFYGIFFESAKKFRKKPELPPMIQSLDFFHCLDLEDEDLNLIFSSKVNHSLSEINFQKCTNLTLEGIKHFCKLLQVHSFSRAHDFHLILPYHPFKFTIHLEEIQSLFENFPQIDFEFQDNVSFLYWACCRGYLSIVKLILEKTGNRYVNRYSTSFGETALYWACDQGKVEFAELLLQFGANPNQECYDRDAPLMIASYNGNIEIVKLLLKYGVDINQRDADQESALDIAKNKNHYEIIQLLEEAQNNQLLKSKNNSIS